MTTKLPQITVDHHFAIANVAARSSQMEIHIEKTVAKGLLNQPKTAESLLKNLGSDRVVGVLKSILLDAAPEEKRRIDNLIKPSLIFGQNGTKSCIGLGIPAWKTMKRLARALARFVSFVTPPRRLTRFSKSRK